MLKLRHVYKTYQNDRHVLRDLNFETNESGLYFIKGESGSGKTTLFKLLTAMIKPTSGEIFFNSVPISNLTAEKISEYRKNVGIIFQDYKLISRLTIAENITLPMKIQKKSSVEIQNKLGALIEKLNLGDFINEYPEHISGGQQQKAAVARALIADPELIIADEPTGNLDAQNSLALIQILSDYAAGHSIKGATVFIATHDESILKKNNQRILTLQNGQLNL